MSENTRLETTERWEDLIGRNTRSGIWHRLRHSLWAGLVVFALFALSFLAPVDEVLWGVQSRVSTAEPSNQFAYVSVSDDLTEPSFSGRRSDLARAIEQLDRLGADRIYIDYVFEKPALRTDDLALSGAIDNMGDRVALMPELVPTLEGSLEVAHTLPHIRGDASEPVNPDATGVLGFTWWIPRSIEVEGETYETLASALLNEANPSSEGIMVDYSIALADIPQASFEDLINPEQNSTDLSFLAGKSVVIGPSRAETDDSIRIPGARSIPLGMVSIYAAESHLAGRNVFIPGFLVVLATLFAIGVCSSIVTKRWRHSGYFLIAASFPAFVLFSIQSGVRAELSYALVLLVIFGLLRLRFHWQRRASMHDDETGLGTLRALEESLGRGAQEAHVVVAKVHGYERVLKLLPASLQSTYIRKIAERLKATEPDLQLFAGSHYFAWKSAEADPVALEDHLNGLRALFGAPLDIAGTPVDVGMTFGVARNSNTSGRALPAAMAAVEETSEAHEPVRFAIERSQDESLWDISLRSRIDAAMNNGEVYCLYQPKYALGTSKVAGVEALVRWDDPERGPIPPLVFVQESEKAGRIEQLTRYVLQSACTAGRLLHARGHRISVSVNVSAIQCSDTRIVTTVEEALKASGFPASYLVLEVTETARIRDLGSAARVLTQLKELGVKLSMDDFGVGMANYETFYELPFDELKIDRLFIKDIQTDSKARAIASSLVKMGAEARITVTAEGVEDPEDLTILEEIGCTQVQGYAISRPITLPNLLDFLENRQKNMV